MGPYEPLDLCVSEANKYPTL